MVRCVIVDDEPLAIEVIESYLSRVKDFDVLARFSDPVEAFTYLQQHTPDLLFLDLHMPFLGGFEMLKSMQQKPAVIVTTAYREFAVEGFELDVLDYLVKPIAFPRFLRAISKLQSASAPSVENGPAESTPADKVLWLKVDKKLVPVDIGDILYVQSLKDYVRVVTSSRKLITYCTLQSLQEKLSPAGFVRLHKSYLVQLLRVQCIEGNMVHIGHERLPIGRSYRQALLGLIDKTTEAP